MAEQGIREFFREKVAKSARNDVDWQARRDEWVRSVEGLYRTIVERYLAGPIADGTVTPSFEDREINEQYIGQYTVPILILKVGDEKAVFVPKGANIVGASGRIDLRGDMGEVTIVRQPGDRWSVVATRAPTLKVVDLNEESLLAALKNVMRR